MLNVQDVHDCLTLEVELEAWLHRQLGHVDSEALRWLCPECLVAFDKRNNPIMHRDAESGELVCTVCGTVQLDPCDSDPSDSLPFGLTWSPASQLAINKSLGTNADMRTMWALSKETKLTANYLEPTFKTLQNDLKALKFPNMNAVDILIESVKAYLSTPQGKEAMRVNLMMFGRGNRLRMESTQEYGVQTCLKYAYSLAAQISLGDHADVVFLNTLGSNVRKAFFLKQHGFKVQHKVLAETMLALTLKMFKKETVIHKSRTKLRVHQGLFQAVLKYSVFINELLKLDVIVST
jgi:hypothetical protein